MCWGGRGLCGYVTVVWAVGCVAVVCVAGGWLCSLVCGLCGWLSAVWGCGSVGVGRREGCVAGWGLLAVWSCGLYGWLSAVWSVGWGCGLWAVRVVVIGCVGLWAVGLCVGGERLCVCVWSMRLWAVWLWGCVAVCV